MVYQVVELPSEHWTCGAIVHVSVYKWNAGCYIYVLFQVRLDFYQSNEEAM